PLCPKTTTLRMSSGVFIFVPPYHGYATCVQPVGSVQRSVTIAQPARKTSVTPRGRGLTTQRAADTPAHIGRAIVRAGAASLSTREHPSRLRRREGHGTNFCHEDHAHPFASNCIRRLRSPSARVRREHRVRQGLRVRG